MKWLKWNHRTARRILLFFLLAETMLLGFFAYQTFSSFYPGYKTFKANTRWRPNPTWKTGGLNTTFTLKQDYSFQNISYPNLNFKAMTNNVGYWVNVTSGSDCEVNIWQWFTDSTVTFEYITTGTFISQLYVGSLGAPTVTGADISSYDDATKIVEFTTTPSSSQFVYFTWNSYSFSFHGLFNETTGLRISNPIFTVVIA